MPKNDEVLAVIPARYDSKRFPGKVLVSICGKSMIEHVWRRVSGASRVDRAVVATDDERVVLEVGSFGGEVVLTDMGITSGSDRVAAVARDSGAAIIVNVQGDEPLIRSETIDDLIRFMMEEESADIGTVIRPLKEPHELLDPNAVKAVVATDGRVLYFSRSLIPYHSHPGELTAEKLIQEKFFVHIGIYAYRRGALFRLTSLPPSDLEIRESLEQMRALENGITIYAIVRDVDSIGVDLPSHIPLVEKRLKEQAE